MAKYLLISGANEIVSITSEASVQFLTGEDANSVEVLPSGNSILCNKDTGLIEALGPDEEIAQIISKIDPLKVEQIKADGMVVMPGLVDGHSHPVWDGDRSHEFEMKLAGASYMEIHQVGGGIHFTVGKTQEASEERLVQLFKERAEAISNSGTTLLEAKSGYGLNLETELKMLRVVQTVADDMRDRLEISGTYCGAHAVPKDKTPDEQTENILRQIDAISTLKRSSDDLRSIENIDVFCEKGVFDVTQSKRILTAGINAGLTVNFHGDELYPTGSAEMGADIGARAISHLEEISDVGIEAMAKSKTAAVILPTTAYILKLKSPPIKKMIQAGVPIALGSDFNPNAHTYAMPMVMNMACVLFGFTLPQALIGATLNAAYSLNRGRTHGAIQEATIFPSSAAAHKS